MCSPDPIDVYHLEVCIFNQICANGRELFRLSRAEERAGLKRFTCHFSEAGFADLQRLLLAPSAREPSYGDALHATWTRRGNVTWTCGDAPVGAASCGQGERWCDGSIQ